MKDKVQHRVCSSLCVFLGASVRIRHSADFGTPKSHNGQVVAIIIGSLSVVEITGLLVPYPAKIYHVHSKPFFAISKYLPTDAIPSEMGEFRFLLLDLFFHRCSIRPDMHEMRHPTPEMNRLRTAFFSSLYRPLQILISLPSLVSPTNT
jgi:hypothetical protein